MVRSTLPDKGKAETGPQKFQYDFSVVFSYFGAFFQTKFPSKLIRSYSYICKARFLQMFRSPCGKFRFFTFTQFSGRVLRTHPGRPEALLSARVPQVRLKFVIFRENLKMFKNLFPEAYYSQKFIRKCFGMIFWHSSYALAIRAETRLTVYRPSRVP